MSGTQEGWSSTSIPRSEISLSKDAPCGQVSEVGSSLFCQHQHRNLLSLCSSVIILFLDFQDQHTRQKQRQKNLFWLTDSEGSVHHGEVKQMDNLSPIMTDQGIKRRECYYCDGTTLSPYHFFFLLFFSSPHVVQPVFRFFLLFLFFGNVFTKIPEWKMLYNQSKLTTIRTRYTQDCSTAHSLWLIPSLSVKW